jgi:hypothetical protein
MKHVFTFWTGKQTSEFFLEASFLAFPYKSDNNQVSREGYGHYILWYMRCSAKPLCSSEKDSHWELICNISKNGIHGGNKEKAPTST